ncbi:N-acetylglucosamine-6-phosphate deacetylase [Prochlorococcus sp. MIT 1307]|uniref:N-acetylglucosamine-6-phosphate deacetylase n=1 Tax=Prochlorococcus sp. MIT 1307 TaxID=3096219 RepID=UPI002A757809|nr:N-acetylglucosamine-6-phosphate deacetylase [Prochlorococcus sp. MIT 1307]
MRRITHVRLPEPLGNCEGNLWWVLLDEQDIVLSIHPMERGSSMAGAHWGGDWLSPMGIDLQMNGGLGLAFPELTDQDLPILLDLLDKLWLDGVEAICPTFISGELAAFHLGLDVLRKARKLNSSNRCKLLGAHLEGPFLAQERCGAHSREFLSSPSLSALHQLIGGREDEIDLVTLAPELDGSLEVITRLKNLGVIVCLGHSSANEKICRFAFDQGVSMLTHGFNAMPGLGHRAPGPIGEAINHGGIAIGLIADGAHIHPSIAVLLQRVASKQVVLVSDAIAPYGLQDGNYTWDKRSIISEKGCCRLENGTLAGSTVPLLKACQNLARWSGEASSAIWSATIAPRLVLAKTDKSNDYLIGQPLKHLLRWTMNVEQDELSWQRAA